MGPQTRLLQNNDTQMIEKIQSSLVNTIPLWKSQMVLALGMEHSRQATAAQNAVTEMTNDLLKKNADTLKMGTIATAKEAERSISFCFSSPSILPSAPYDLTSSDEMNSSCGKVSASRNACARHPARVRLRRAVELG